jgi:methylthioribose-1-phosphate isomerase
VAEAETPTANPAFDVTPPGLIHAIVTERGIIGVPDEARIRAHLASAAAGPSLA